MSNHPNPVFMQRAIDLATENVRSGKGGPFAAVIVILAFAQIARGQAAQGGKEIEGTGGQMPRTSPRSSSSTFRATVP